MGNPYAWYKSSLEYLAHLLTDNSRNIKIFENMSQEELERYIGEHRRQISDKCFYYRAGIAAAYMIDDADKCGCDALNASAGGLAQFEEFIGIED